VIEISEIAGEDLRLVCHQLRTGTHDPEGADYKVQEMPVLRNLRTSKIIDNAPQDLKGGCV